MKSRHNSLDLLRAAAIFSVVVAHSVLAYGAPAALAPLQLGGIGVDLFFVLSGWLLGGQLARELANTGSIDLTRFWSRRWLRTLPAYYAVLIPTLVEQAVWHSDRALHLDYLIFLQNYTTSLPYFYVSWSLCVEEHFYLLIAPALLLFHRLARYRWMGIALVLFTPMLFRRLHWYTSLEQTHVSWDGCMVGVALALCQVTLPRVWERLTRYSPYIGSLSALMLLANLVGRYDPRLGLPDYDQLVYAMLFGALVLLAMHNAYWQQHFYVIGARYVAERSYSIYLVHPEALALLKRFGPTLPFPIFFVLACAGSCIVAEALYQLVEQPFMRLRERLAFASASQAG